MFVLLYTLHRKTEHYCPLWTWSQFIQIFVNDPHMPLATSLKPSVVWFLWCIISYCRFYLMLFIMGIIGAFKKSGVANGILIYFDWMRFWAINRTIFINSSKINFTFISMNIFINSSFIYIHRHLQWQTDLSCVWGDWAAKNLSAPLAFVSKHIKRAHIFVQCFLKKYIWIFTN